MLSKPIPLSVPVQDGQDSMESVDDLLSSIRQLMSPEKISPEIVDLNRPIRPETWPLSEKTMSESTDALSSFVSALEQPYAGTPKPAAQAPKNAPTSPAETGCNGQGSVRLEEFISQCLKAPLEQWIGAHEDRMTAMVRGQVHQHVMDLLRQWLDAHLPGLIKESIDRHLQSLIDVVRKTS